MNPEHPYLKYQADRPDKNGVYWVDMSKVPWWRKDGLGWPIETVKGKPISNFIRLVVQNIRKWCGK
jgi:hypothetical protein